MATALPPCSNNVSEYNALLLALKILASNGKWEYPKIYSDSAVVVNQVNRKWECKSPDLLPFLFSVRLIQHDYPFQLVQVPRRVTYLPDSLCNKFLDAAESLTLHNMDDVVNSTLQ